MQLTPVELTKGVADQASLSLDSVSSEKREARRNTSRAVLEIFFSHNINKFDLSRQWLEAGADYFTGVIEEFVSQNKRIEACLPAFPFKSANKVYKVLGSLPDKAEELALNRLHTMCDRIQAIYPPGARVTIVSDGITYNGKVPQSPTQ